MSVAEGTYSFDRHTNTGSNLDYLQAKGFFFLLNILTFASSFKMTISGGLLISRNPLIGSSYSLIAIVASHFSNCTWKLKNRNLLLFDQVAVSKSDSLTPSPLRLILHAAVDGGGFLREAFLRQGNSS